VSALYRNRQPGGPAASRKNCRGAAIGCRFRPPHPAAVIIGMGDSHLGDTAREEPRIETDPKGCRYLAGLALAGPCAEHDVKRHPDLRANATASFTRCRATERLRGAR
jgi:hypothetical protein